MRVKKPAESKAPWDYYTVLETVPGDQAFHPLSDSLMSLGSQRLAHAKTHGKGRLQS